MEEHDPAWIRTLERPHPNLMKLYTLQAMCGLIAFPAIIVPLYFRYHTLRYKLDDEGISASWGILFRREVYLTYRRIQDIHVSRNLFERWLGIAKVELQTASGSSSAELVLEGMDRYEEVRDWLYRRMRGGSETPAARPGAVSSVSSAPSGGSEPSGEILALLEGIRIELEGARKALEARS